MCFLRHRVITDYIWSQRKITTKLKQHKRKTKPKHLYIFIIWYLLWNRSFPPHVKSWICSKPKIPAPAADLLVYLLFLVLLLFGFVFFFYITGSMGCNCLSTKGKKEDTEYKIVPLEVKPWYCANKHIGKGWRKLLYCMCVMESITKGRQKKTACWQKCFKYLVLEKLYW